MEEPYADRIYPTGTHAIGIVVRGKDLSRQVSNGRPSMGASAERKRKDVSREASTSSKGRSTSSEEEQYPQEPETGPHFNFRMDPHEPETREKFLRRRRIFSFLMRKYQQLKDRGVNLETHRIDLKASTEMKKNRLNYDYKGFGDVPGINVGDCFFYRAELVAVGLHWPYQAGIAWQSDGEDKVGCSIVASGGYEDDVDNGDTLIYTGHGGNNYKSDRRQGGDQEPRGGNLALIKSHRSGTPVRVIRGHSKIPITQSPSEFIYSYDGLYEVHEYRYEEGNAGWKVFKFYLRRLPDQPELGSKLVQFIGKKPPQRTDVLMTDFSRGMERVPVCVVNDVDGARPPSSFQYTTKLHYPKGLSLAPLPPSCSCNDACENQHGGCFCVERNKGKMLPYNHNGLLVSALPCVYECGRQCKCSKERCYNSVSQKGLQHRLEIFRTVNKGWGVRSWDFIPSGGFVCEYTGQIIDNQTANELEDDEYLFNLDFKQGNEARWGDLCEVLEDVDEEVAQPVTSTAKYAIDASKLGGVARFINHSCEPNLFVQCVLYDHNDLEFPHVMLFANTDIRPFQELTYDYGYALDSVYDLKGNLKQKRCHCGAPTCRRRLY